MVPIAHVARMAAVSCAVLSLTLTSTITAAEPGVEVSKRSKACFGDTCVSKSRSKYLGEFCWTYAFEEGEGPLLVGVFHTGGRHFLLNGKVSEGGDLFLVTGSAEYVGEDLVFFLRSPGGGLDIEIPFPDPDNPQIVNVVGTATFYATLDPHSLEGQALLFEATAFEEDPEGLETGISYGGALSLTPADCDSLDLD